MKKLILSVFVILFALNAFAAVNINTAAKEELQTLSGIGPEKAEAIIDYRTKNGPFQTVDDLAKVRGFGEKTVEKLRSDISVSDKAKAGSK